jgi:HEAT repeat protein
MQSDTRDVKGLIEQLKAASPEEARAACRDLFYRLRDASPEEVRAIYEGLARFDPGIATAALGARRDRQESESARAYARGLSVAQARQVIDHLAWLLGDSPPDEYEPTEQARQMAAFGLERPELLPDFLDLLRSRPQLRGQISWVLGQIGRERRGVGEALTPLLRDPDPAVADAAAAALFFIGGGGWRSDGAVEALLELYERGTKWPPRAFISPVGEALSSLGSSGCEESVVGAVVQRIRQAPARHWREGWFDLLGVIAMYRVPQAITALLELLRDGDPDIRYRAAVKCRGPWGREVVTALCAATQDPDDQVRGEAVTAVQDCGPEWAGAVVPALVAAVGDRRSWIGAKAAHCLSRLGAAAKGALPAVRARLRAANAAAKAAVAELRAAPARERAEAYALREQLREELEAVRVLRAAAVRLRDAAAGE